MARISKRNQAPSQQVVCGDLSKKVYKTAIYARLSSAHDSKKNESVEVQMDIAKEFVEQFNRQEDKERMEIVDSYIDLGKTGTNFNRDEFTRLMQDIRLGDVDCIIVKDLSRFGRNYLEAGNYIEKIFPFLGVRFVAVTDGLDTGADGNDTKEMTLEIKNLVNDMYAKDFSKKAKLHLQQRREKGSYVGGPPPYGYVALWKKKKRTLVRDENTAIIVQFIFEEFVRRGNYQAVTDELNKRKINPPSVYKKAKQVYCPEETAYKGWDKGTVMRILASATYIGRLEQGKTSITARDESNRIHKEKEEWIVQENAHEAIILPELYEKVQQIRKKIQEKTQRKRQYKHSVPLEENIFDSILYCGACGHKMTRSSSVKTYANGEQARIEGYFCLNSNASKVDYCQESNYISKNILVEIVLQALKLEFAVSMEKPKRYQEYGKQKIEETQKRYQREIQQKEGKIISLREKESDQYIKYKSGEILQSVYVAMKMEYAKQIEECETEKLEALSAMQYVEETRVKFEKSIPSLLKLRTAKVLSKNMLEALIERIHIYPGKRVEIIYRYTDDFMRGVR